MEQNRSDIIIIGAGMAGLEAARCIGEAGHNAIVLEARDQIGGRVFTVRDSADCPIELGAEFIHGRPPEIWELIKSAKLDTREVKGDQWRLQGAELTKKDFFSDLEKILNKMDDRGLDRSFRDFLFECQDCDDHVKGWAMEYIQGFHAAYPEKISLHSLVASLEADEKIDGDRSFRLLKGYQQISEQLRRKINDHQVRILTSTVVSEVRWRRGEVQVTAQSAAGNSRQTFESSQCLVTLPLGVLQQPPETTGSVRFIPDIAQKRPILDQLTMGSVIRVTLRFREKFWEEAKLIPHAAGKNLSRLSFMFSHDEWFPTWWSHVDAKQPVLTGWAAGPRGAKLSNLADPELAECALDSLSRILGTEKNILQSLTMAAHVHNWQTDPFFRGAYSYALVGGGNASRHLAEPMDDTLFFAGEAADFGGHSGTVHGAIASGRRAAEQALSTANASWRQIRKSG